MLCFLVSEAVSYSPAYKEIKKICCRQVRTHIQFYMILVIIVQYMLYLLIVLFLL